MNPSIPDPRPRLGSGDGDARLEGLRCRSCRYPTAFARPACPVCSGTLEPAGFGPEGTVWSSTTVHVRVPDREPPYRLAYVDLDDGPRVLALVTGEDPTDVGTRVRLLDGKLGKDGVVGEGGENDGDVRVEVLR